jgi:hypothetical protein
MDDTQSSASSKEKMLSSFQLTTSSPLEEHLATVRSHGSKLAEMLESFIAQATQIRAEIVAPCMFMLQ